LPAPEKSATTIGIIGGGQLAKMLVQAASQFGCEVVILERAPGSPAESLARKTIHGDWDDPEILRQLGSQADVVTLENEFVKAASLEALEKSGGAVWPSSRTMRVVQDKLLQKQTLAAAGLPLPKFQSVASVAEVEAAGNVLGWPLVLKKRCNGYDGKGNFTVRKKEDISQACTQLVGASNALYVEEFCEFTAELAVMLTRGRDGGLVIYPVVETVQRDHICHVVKAPAEIPAAVAARVADIARRAVESTGMIGSMGVELFLKGDGTILINELAPRVHNSGHYTIEACACSQFENHIRAVLGWPLGSSAMRAPAAVMVNLLGAGSGSGAPRGLPEALAIPEVHPHIYGKSASAPGRKMGHVTALGDDLPSALDRARRAAALIQFGSKT
jgi:5-(carboxyamino)imidazole ribonucleotide synthase